MDDLATFQSLARLVFRVGLEQRPHPVRHLHQFLVTLFAKHLPILSKPFVQLLENVV